MLFKTIMSEDVETEKEGQEDPKEETGIISNQISEEGVEREEGEEEEVEVAQDHELKVLPENEEEDKEEILITDATKRPPTAKTTKIINKKQRGGGRRRRKALPDEMTKVLNRQTVEIDKMALLVQSILKQLKPLKIQSELIKQLQSQLRQIQKQMSQIQKGIIITKKQQNKNKKKGE
ncbi:MAG: hypothetical protein ACJ71L_02320 [Nitrososphaeraceae archaeon]